MPCDDISSSPPLSAKATQHKIYCIHFLPLSCFVGFLNRHCFRSQMGLLLPFNLLAILKCPLLILTESFLWLLSFGESSFFRINDCSWALCRTTPPTPTVLTENDSSLAEIPFFSCQRWFTISNPLHPNIQIDWWFLITIDSFDVGS